MSFEKLFDGTIPCGVYRITQADKLSDLESLCLQNDFSYFVFDGTTIHDDDDFLKRYEVVLQPDEYGENWNSMQSSLYVTRWLTTKGVVIVYDNFQNFMIAERAGFDIALDVFSVAVDLRNKKRVHPEVKPLYILLRGDDGMALRMSPL